MVFRKQVVAYALWTEIPNSQIVRIPIPTLLQFPEQSSAGINPWHIYNRMTIELTTELLLNISANCSYIPLLYYEFAIKISTPAH
jgi:hypothetical protein